MILNYCFTEETMNQRKKNYTLIRKDGMIRRDKPLAVGKDLEVTVGLSLDNTQKMENLY